MSDQIHRDSPRVGGADVAPGESAPAGSSATESSPTESSTARLRAADVDRERVVELLKDAHGAGRLTLDEFDERAGAAWAARTRGELAAITADLPQPVAERAQPALPTAVHPAGRECAAGRAWLVASVLNVVIWAVVSVAAGAAVYPWFIWVAGPWGVVLLLRRFADAGGLGLARARLGLPGR